MNKGKISVIVAIYNVEQYLHKCIDSILAQTYENLEIILVDDGSPDKSGAICDEYAQKDSRVKVIHKQNGGQSTARNAALDIATGEYIGFVDGDDWIEPEMYQILYSTMVNEGADIVQCGWYIVEPNGKKDCPYPDKYKKVLTSDEALDSLIDFPEFPLNTSVCCKLFRKRLVDWLRFSPVRAYEDDEFVYKAVSLANKIVCINSPLYDYFNRAESTMTAKFNMNKFALVTIQKSICDLLKLRYPKRYAEVEKTLCSKQFYILSCLLDNLSLKGAQEKSIELKTAILSSYNDYMQNPFMGKNKLMLWLMRYTPQFVWATVLKTKFA